MKSVFILLVVMTIFKGISASALSYYPVGEEQCSPVDFRLTFPMKMRNQGGTSWCFANAAADYLQFAYHLDVQISAADIAINYSQYDISKIIKFFKNFKGEETRKGPPETGFISIAVKKIIPQGYCPESVLPSDFWNRVDGINGVQNKEEILQSILDTFQLQEKIYTGEIDSPSKMPWYFSFPQINREQFFKILKNSTHKNVLINLRDAACMNERKPFEDELVEHVFHRRSKHVFVKMNESFDRGLPVTVDFFDDLILHYDHPRRKIDDLHTVLVYGRKFDAQAEECEYLLKDSHGAQCTKYDSQIQCENGYLWIPESKLFRALTSLLVFW